MNIRIKDIAREQSAICGIFANPNRILILWAIIDGEKPVGVIADEIGCSLQNTSQHLRLMKNIGILTSRREAQTIYYSIAADEIKRLCSSLIDEGYKLTQKT